MVNTPWKRTKEGYGGHKDRHFHRVVPLAENPCEGADYGDAVFSQRHEANPDELCFDLFFVANLATFTAYHTIDDVRSLAAYVGFFAILWATWFQITLHDVRFARDSVYERGCKTVQFIVFVGLALAGSKFEPGGHGDVKKGSDGDTISSDKSNVKFRTLCYVLVLSRSMLALQYAFVIVAVSRKRFSKLYLPLGLNTAIYVAAAATFGAMIPAFADGVDGDMKPKIYWLWWVVLFLEGVGTIGISCFWRMLSFKKTHLVERMGLLTLIVIGEGAIGVTKTVSKMMGKYGLDAEGCLLVGCIVLLLVILFLTYFDNTPHGHYGTIRQQIWALLHFPFQLAVVGVVEGSQQLALARYIMNGIRKFQAKIAHYCVEEALEGDKLIEKLKEAIKYYQLDTKPECFREVMRIKNELGKLANMTGICAKSYTDEFPSAKWPQKYPPEFGSLVNDVWSGVTMSTGMKVPVYEEPYLVLQQSWKVVYIYYWAALVTIFACMIAFLVLIRSRKFSFDLFDAASIGGRINMLSLCLVLACLAAVQKNPASPTTNPTTSSADSPLYIRILSTGFVLPAGTAMLGLCLAADHVARVVCNWRLQRRGFTPPPPPDEDKHHHDGGGHGARPGAHNRHSSSGSALLLLNHQAGEEVDIDEVLEKRRAEVRKSRAFGFKSGPAPRPASAVYLLGNFAASLASGGRAASGGGTDGGGDNSPESTPGLEHGPVLQERPGGGRLTWVGSEGRERGNYSRVDADEV